MLTAWQWAEKLGMKKATLLVRLKKGWSIDRAMTEAVA